MIENMLIIWAVLAIIFGIASQVRNQLGAANMFYVIAILLFIGAMLCWN